MNGEEKARIRQLYYRDHWPVGTIASNLGLHPETVKKALSLDKRKIPVRVTEITQYRPFIESILGTYPKLRATRILDMLRERGYGGTVYPIRKIKREIMRKTEKAYLDLKFLPGEQAQVDWASFGKMSYGAHQRALNLFIMVLSYSRRIYGRFFHDMKAARVLEGHQKAFAYFGGAPRTVLVDNMKTAVITNAGSAVQFNEDFLELAAHYCFIPKACTPRAAWEKGRVEKAVRYIRDRFFAARDFTSIADLNNQLEAWLGTISDQRPWADDSSRTVQQVFHEEKLVAFDNQFEPYEERYVRVDKKAFISFDTNKYPVPPEHVGRKLGLRATHDEIILMWDGKCIMRRVRVWHKHQKIQCPDHQKSIGELRNIERNRRRSVLEATLSCGGELLQEWLRLGESLSHQARRVLELAEGYGLKEVEAACLLALENGTPRSCSIEQILIDKRPPPSPQFTLPEGIADIEINHKPMSDFDELY